MFRSAALACMFVFLVALPLRADAPKDQPVKVPFDVLTTKHIVIQIKINGKGPYRVIFDTGAPVSLINSKTAKATGLLTKNAPNPLFSLFGPAAQTKIKTLEIGELKAEAVPIIVMDHPTVSAISQVMGPIEGIVGFPFFARYRMSLDYQAKQLTFAPNGFEPTDIIQALTVALMAGQKTEKKFLVPEALWGFAVDKDATDQEPGITVKDVYAQSAAAKSGLKPGDRLLSLDDRWTDSVADCYVAVSYVKPATGVTLVIERDGKEVKLTVRPQAGL